MNFIPIFFQNNGCSCPPTSLTGVAEAIVLMPVVVLLIIILAIVLMYCILRMEKWLGDLWDWIKKKYGG